MGTARQAAPGGSEYRAAGVVRLERAVARDRYFDLLRTIALLRVVAYHTFGWAWLTILFPAIGVMFALAGSLMARSLTRKPLGVIKSRSRRLLVPLWVFGLVVLGTLFWQGWKPERADQAQWWFQLLYWLVPLGDPPFPDSIGTGGGLLDPTWAGQVTGPLWYLRAYLWFVLLSPLLLKAFRRLPWPTLLAPIAVVAILETGAITIPGQAGTNIIDFGVYGACWMLGFAHHDGLLQKIPRPLLVVAALVLMAAGLWWASDHLGAAGWNLDQLPLAQALWSLGFCSLLLIISPSWFNLPGCLRRFDKLVTLTNYRAVTLYLWHEIALVASVPLIDLLWAVPALELSVPWLLESTFLQFVLIWPLIGLLILAFGWAEDIAAKRRPRLWPTGAASPAARRPARL